MIDPQLRRRARLLLALIAAISLFLGGQLPRIGFYHDLEAFFPAHIEDTEYFLRYRDTFGNDIDYLMVGLRHEAGIFDSTFLVGVDSLGAQLARIPGIESVLSPTRVRRLRRPVLGTSLEGPPFLQIDRPARYARDSAAIYAHPHLPGWLFAHDRRSVCLYLQTQPRPDAETCAQLADTIQTILATHAFDDHYLAGKCFGQTAYIRQIEREIIRFTVISVAMIMLFLWLTYRRVWAVWLPMLVVGLTVVWTLGIMVLAGKQIDIISHIIPTILLVVGIANLVHLLTHYLLRLREAATPLVALKASVREVGLATVLTTATTAMGFLTLSTSSFVPLAELGRYATLGLLIALLLSYTLAPALLVLWPGLSNRPARHLLLWQKPLEALFHKISRHTGPIIGLSLLLLGGALWSASHLVVNRYVLDDFKAAHPQRRDLAVLEAQFGGARAFELHLWPKAATTDLTDPALLAEIERVDAYLRQVYAVRKLISPAVLVREANQLYHFGQARYDRIPETQAAVAELVALSAQQGPETLPAQVLSADRRQGRITGMIADLGSHEIGQRNAALEAWLAANTSLLDYRLTGSLHLIDLNDALVVQNVLGGLAVAVVLVGILFALLMRSWIMVGITLLVNLLPLVAVAGFMPLAGIDLKIPTAMIFIISFGIAVDDSIHFLSRFRREVRTHTVAEALRRTYLSTGKAIILTSLILCAGFLTLSGSDFLSTFYIGLLISLTLLLALLADMVLLPALILRLYRKKGP